MTDRLTDALTGAATAVARDPDNSLTIADAGKVANAMAQQMPAPRALESLWPQLMRYGISGLGVALASRGIGPELDWQAAATAIVDVVTGQGDAADWKVTLGSAIAIAPPLWRTATTWWSRRLA
ncbi:hypothetical protein ABLE91_16785 [Aquabacter sp. CN5-332]|uniref:hypothetical protein n=1 Tax=Aquabacter sp. CN5-332 TaxID=3156608 RepID=UPI0032B495CA